MDTQSDHRSVAAPSLAQRLRELRDDEVRRLTHGRMALTQGDLARVLGGSEPLSGATVSAWENSGRVPPAHRLAAYARLFCTCRSFTDQGPQLLDANKLTDEEIAQMQLLNDELQALRKQARRVNGGSASAAEDQNSIWAFPKGEAVNIACSESREDQQPLYANPSHLNYSRYAKWVAP